MGLLAEFDRRIPGLWEGVKANLLFPGVGEMNVLMCGAPHRAQQVLNLSLPCH